MTAREVLELARNSVASGAEAEVFVSRGDSLSVAVRNSGESCLESHLWDVAGLRVRAGGRMGFSAAPSWSSAADLVARSLVCAVPDHGPLRFPGPSPGAQVEISDPRLGRLDSQGCLQVLEELGEAIRAAGAEGFQVDLDLDRSEVTLANTSGGAWRYPKSSVSIEAAVYGRDDRGEAFTVRLSTSSCRLSDLEDWRVRTLDALLARWLCACRRQAHLPGPEGRPARLLLRPEMVHVLMAPLLVHLNPHLGHQAGETGGREQTWPGTFDLFDDGTVPWSTATSPVDGEGVPCQKTPLVVGAARVGVIHDLATAAAAGTVSTGNANRGLYTPPRAGFTTLVLLPRTPGVRDLRNEAGWAVEPLEMSVRRARDAPPGDIHLEVGSGILWQGGEAVGRVLGLVARANGLAVLDRITLREDGAPAWGAGLVSPALLVDGVEFQRAPRSR